MKKRSNHLGKTLALILASALCASTPGFAAQGSDNARQQAQPQQSQQQAQPQQSQQQAQPNNHRRQAKHSRARS
jgi:hypothetical protein